MTQAQDQNRWHDLITQQVANQPKALSYSDNTGISWSWQELDQAVRALESELRAAGVVAGDRVLLLAENCAAAVATLFAASRIGAPVIPFNARQTEAEINRVITHATPAAIVLTTHVSDNAIAHSQRMGGKTITGAFGSLDLVARPSDPDPDLSDVGTILYTTGTTGAPKGVMLTHGNLRFGGKASAELRGMSPKDKIYGVLPITHVFGLASVVTASAHAGAHVQLESRFTAAKLYDALHHGVTLLSAVPQMHALLMQYTKEQGFETLGSSKLRYVSSGGAPLDPAWKRKAEAFYEVVLQNGYGMTETTAGICATSNELGDPDISTGPPLPGVEIHIQGDAQTGGNILTRGPHVMSGYFRNPEATAAALDSDGWLHTGDVGRLDERGHLHILGRTKELIIHGGFNVYPPEVEAALTEHPQVVQAAVIGHIVEGDEKVLAFCQVADYDRPDLAELQRFVAERLTGYKRPSHIVMAASLPASPTGKILKHKLRDAFRSELDSFG
ncbi:MAG: acyl--CoA ligase [Pelagimonas sp.]|jgi:acyl-CoA synthetase (AMP-forming)/AMP-acid ligase II|nr:acyl--CoA ligase [Pelagimonas sp.]